MNNTFLLSIYLPEYTISIKTAKIVKINNIIKKRIFGVAAGIWLRCLLKDDPYEYWHGFDFIELAEAGVDL
jgi:hypothetical protein